jgi:Tol biopolymer transport system component
MKWLMAVSVTLLVSVYVGSAQRGALQRVSLGIPRGLLGNASSYGPSISGDGRWIAFSSGANNFVPNDTNNARDVFVYDTQTETIRRISVSNTGAQGNDGSYDPRISRDGRYVVFLSAATNLVPNDTNDRIDAFVYDLHTNQITRVSVSSTGEQANDHIWAVDISADGRFVVFETHASNLVPDDTNNAYDIFVHDLHTRQTKRVSVSSSGNQVESGCQDPRISGDGNLIVFSSSGELVPDDTNFVGDIYLHDQRTGITRRVSIGWNGQEADARCVNPAISADGRYVAFQSLATNLVPNDTNNFEDIFVVDLQTNRIERVSVSSSGEQANRYSWYPALSADGRFVAFQSVATNLVASDTNNGWDIFVRDRQTGRTFRVSLTFLDSEAGGDNILPEISADGRFVVFQSSASNLIPNDWNVAWDIFVRDTQAATTRCVSVSNPTPQANGNSNLGALSGDGRFVVFNSAATNLIEDDRNYWRDIFVRDVAAGVNRRVSIASTGAEADRDSFSPTLSADGQIVAFVSAATNLVPNDTNNARDIFVHDVRASTIRRVSVSSSGGQGNGDSDAPAVSADGRFVAFVSASTNLVPNDTNRVADVFVHDLQTGQTERVSVASDGSQANGASRFPAMSADGRYVVFESAASNLVPNDTNNAFDIFIHDRQTRQTRRVSVSSTGVQGNGNSRVPAISADGRYVAFASNASNFVAGDVGIGWDIFVHDTLTGETRCVSRSNTGALGNNHSLGAPTISGDGRFVAFSSSASNLVPGDTNNVDDIFVYDTQTATIRRVSVSASGEQGNRPSSQAQMSLDGRFVAFHSEANNLVPDDTNGFADIFIYQFGACSLPGDITCDGCVDDADLTAVLNAFGTTRIQEDLDNSGTVDDADLLLVLFNFGRGC